MRRLLLLFTGFSLNQAQTFSPQYRQCLVNRAPAYIAALQQADACVDYDGTDENQCLASNRSISDPNFCTLLSTSADFGTSTSINSETGVSCKNFISVASQFCPLIGKEINPNFVAANLTSGLNPTQSGVGPEQFWILGLFSVTPELYNESCRDIVRNTYSQSPEAQEYYDTVNVMCQNRDSSEDDNNQNKDDDNKDDDNNLAIGLGVGLGVGIPVVGILVYFIVKRKKKEERTESIEPFLS